MKVLRMKNNSVRKSKFLFVFVVLFISSGCNANGNSRKDDSTNIINKKYQLIFGAKNSVCKHMKKIFEDDVSHFGYIKYMSHPEFNAIAWSVGSYKKMFNGREYKSFVEFASIDINNDSKKETVAREDVYLYGYAGKQILVFKNNTFDFTENPTIENEDFKKNPGIKVSGK